MPRKPALDKTDDKHLSRRVLVVIDRDMTAKVSAVVFQHEIPILEAVYGDDKVKELAPDALDDGYNAKVAPSMLPFNKTQDPIRPPSETAGIGHVFTGDPRTEYDRLCAVYGKHPEVNESMCEHVYGRYQTGTFSRALGEPELSDLPDSQLRALITGYGYAFEVHGIESSDEEKKAAVERRRAFLAMNHQQLVDLAEQLGVQLG